MQTRSQFRSATAQLRDIPPECLFGRPRLNVGQANVKVIVKDDPFLQGLHGWIVDFAVVLRVRIENDSGTQRQRAADRRGIASIKAALLAIKVYNRFIVDAIDKIWSQGDRLRGRTFERQTYFPPNGFFGSGTERERREHMACHVSGLPLSSTDRRLPEGDCFQAPKRDMYRFFYRMDDYGDDDYRENEYRNPSNQSVSRYSETEPVLLYKLVLRYWTLKEEGDLPRGKLHDDIVKALEEQCRISDRLDLYEGGISLDPSNADGSSRVQLGKIYRMIHAYDVRHGDRRSVLMDVHIQLPSMLGATCTSFRDMLHPFDTNDRKGELVEGSQPYLQGLMRYPFAFPSTLQGASMRGQEVDFGGHQSSRSRNIFSGLRALLQ